MKQKIVAAFIMGLITTGIISFTLIGINVGFTEHFLTRWLKSWMVGYTIVIPAILLIGPKVNALVARAFKDK